MNSGEREKKTVCSSICSRLKKTLTEQLNKHANTYNISDVTGDV